jgi:DNA-binding NarL/FixJ family response regulator
LAAQSLIYQEGEEVRKGSKIRVVVVDDSEEVLKGIRSFLEGHREIEVVGEFRDGYHLVDKAKELRPDLIITNIHAPRMSGIEYTLALRETMPNTRFIVFTDLAGSAALKKASEEAVVCADESQLAERLDREIRRLFPGSFGTD